MRTRKAWAVKWSVVAAAMAAATGVLAEPRIVPLDDLGEFHARAGDWRIAAGVAGNPQTEKTLTPTAGTGVLVNLSKEEGLQNLLFTTWEHGDVVIDLEFLLLPGTNSGLFLQGRYELQIRDSWGVEAPKFSDSGGIFQQWDPGRGEGREGFGGHAPRVNAAQAPGVWQRLRVEFRAPRFDAAGNKVEHARFLKVVLNGTVVQDNAEVTGPTRTAPFEDERALGPLMIQGNHGHFAIRALSIEDRAE